VRAEHRKIAGVIERLFEHYVEHPELLPPLPAGAGSGDDRLARRVTDYLAGMTDRYCIGRFTEVDGEVWKPSWPIP
jgi:dGTPase